MTTNIIQLASIRKSKPDPMESKKKQDELRLLHHRVRGAMLTEYERLKGDYSSVKMDFDDFEKWFAQWTLRVNEIQAFAQKVKDSFRKSGKDNFFDDPA